MVTCLNLTKIGPRVAVALLLAGFMAASPVRAADKPASAIDLATLPERAARNYPGSQEPFEQILKLRETGGATAVPALTQVMAVDVLNRRIHGYAASQALFNIGTPEAHQALAKYLLDPRYRANEGIDYAFHWNMAEPARSRFIDQYHLVNLAKELALELTSRVPAGAKDQIEFTVTLKNLSDKPLQLEKHEVYLANLLHFRTSDGHYCRGMETVDYDLGMPTWLTLAPGATHTYRIEAKIASADRLALTTRDMRFDLGQPGKFTVVAMLEAPPRTPEQLAAAKITDAWSGRAVSKPIEVLLPPDGRLDLGTDLSAVESLNRQIERFNAERQPNRGVTPIHRRVSRIEYDPKRDQVIAYDAEGKSLVVLQRQPNDRWKGIITQPYHELAGSGPDGSHSWGQVEGEFYLDLNFTGWQTVASNALARAAVERVLYERPNDSHFYIRVRITNTTDRPLGADLRDYWRVIYPNQWGVSQQDRRGEINERRLKQVADKSALVTDFAAGRLTRIEPGASVDYYREFNAGGRKEVEEEARQFAGKYLVVSLDGQVPVTDGKRIAALSCLWEGDRTAADTDLVIPLPVKWSKVSEAALVVSAVATAEVDAPWGAAVEGVQVRLRADNPLREGGTEPFLMMDARCMGTNQFNAPVCFRGLEVEVDGRWYGWGEPDVMAAFSATQPREDRPVPLIGAWVAADGKEPKSLVLAPGKHTVRVAFQVWPANEPKDRLPRFARALSNPVAIEVQGRKDGAVEAVTPTEPSARELPGHEASLIQAAAVRNAVAVRSEATTDPKEQFGHSGVCHVEQAFRIVESLVGKPPATSVVQVVYAYLYPPHFTQRAIRKGETVIWVMEQEAGRYHGFQALADSAANRTLVCDTLTPLTPARRQALLITQLSDAPNGWRTEEAVRWALRDVRRVTARFRGFPVAAGTPGAVACEDGKHRMETSFTLVRDAAGAVPEEWVRRFMTLIAEGNRIVELAMEDAPRAVADSTTTPVPTVAAGQADGWSDVNERVQVRLQAEKDVWEVGEVELLADARCVGANRFNATASHRGWEIMVDNIWYVWSEPVNEPMGVFDAEHPRQQIRLRLNEDWIRKIAPHTPLALGPGDHDIYVALIAAPSNPPADRPVVPVRAVSRFVRVHVQKPLAKGETPVYVQVIALEPPAKDNVEPWIAKELTARGEKQFRAATPWIRLTDEFTGLDTGLGCPGGGQIVARKSGGDVIVEITGFTPEGRRVKLTVPGKPGASAIGVVDPGHNYVALRTGPSAQETWSPAVGGLRGRLVIAQPKIAVDGWLQATLELENVGQTPLTVFTGNPMLFKASVAGPDDKPVLPTNFRDGLMSPQRVVIEAGKRLSVPVTIESLDGAKGSQVDTTTQIWKLPPSQYVLGGTYGRDAIEESPPRGTWLGRLNLPAVPFEVVAAAAAPPAARVLEPFYRNGWHGWPVGTEVQTTFLDDKVAGWYSYVQPDLLCRVTTNGLERFQMVNGELTVQQLNAGPPDQGTFQPVSIHRHDKGTPAIWEIDGVKVDCLFLEQVSHVDGPSFAGKVHRKEWVLADQPAIWLRTEANKNYKVIKSLREMRQVGDRQVPCVVVEERMEMSGRHQVSTTWLSLEVPGHVVEKINQTWFEGRRQRSHEKLVEMRLPATGKRLSATERDQDQ